jgi:hypothetical protein
VAHEAGRGAVEACARARARDVRAREPRRDELRVGRERLEGADFLGDADARELVAQDLRAAAAAGRPPVNGRGAAGAGLRAPRANLGREKRTWRAPGSLSHMRMTSWPACARGGRARAGGISNFRRSAGIAGARSGLATRSATPLSYQVQPIVQPAGAAEERGDLHRPARPRARGVWAPA